MCGKWRGKLQLILLIPHKFIMVTNQCPSALTIKRCHIGLPRPTTSFLILKTGYCQSFKWHNKSIEGNQFLFQYVQQRGSSSVGSVLRMCEQGLWGSGLTPVSDVVKVCKHLLLADCQKPWLTRWSQYRCLWGEFIVKVTNIFTAFDGRHKWGLDLLCQQCRPIHILRKNKQMCGKEIFSDIWKYI